MKITIHSLLVMLACFAGVYGAGAQATAFTYQGQLSFDGSPANGSYDLVFSL